MQFDFPADFSSQKHRHAQHARVIFLAGWVEVGQFVYLCFHFCHWLNITFKKRKYRRKTENNPIYLNSHRYYMIYCLHCLNTSMMKWNASVPRLLLSPSQPLLVSSQNALYFPVWERARCVTYQITVAKETTLTTFPPTERKIKVIRPQLVTSKI